MNPKHGAISAVSRVAGTTQIAITTTRVYLTNNATTDESAITAIFNHADKLVTNRSIEPRIPTRDLEVGITNPRQRHTHDRLISTIRLLYVFN